MQTNISFEEDLPSQKKKKKKNTSNMSVVLFGQSRSKELGRVIAGSSGCV